MKFQVQIYTISGKINAQIHQIGHIKELGGIDLVIDSTLLTKKELADISNYIQAYRKRRYVKGYL